LPGPASVVASIFPATTNGKVLKLFKAQASVQRDLVRERAYDLALANPAAARPQQRASILHHTPQVRKVGKQLLMGNDMSKSIEKQKQKLQQAKERTRRAAEAETKVRGAFVVLQDPLLARRIISDSPRSAFWWQWQLCMRVRVWFDCSPVSRSGG